MIIPYYDVPVDILENRDLFTDWARNSLFASNNKPSKAQKAKDAHKMINCQGWSGLLFTADGI